MIAPNMARVHAATRLVGDRLEAERVDRIRASGGDVTACDLWIAENRAACGSRFRVRRYLTGIRCPSHTPAALAGRRMVAPDPTRTLVGLRTAS